MPDSNQIPVYDDTLVFPMEGYIVPIVISGQVLIAEASYSNSAINFLAGWLIPFKQITGIGNVDQRWNRLYCGNRKFITINLPYFPQDYQVRFHPSWFFHTRPLTLKIWEVINP